MKWWQIICLVLIFCIALLTLFIWIEGPWYSPWPVDIVVAPDLPPPTEQAPVTASVQMIYSNWFEEHTINFAVLNVLDEVYVPSPVVTCIPDEVLRIVSFDTQSISPGEISEFELQFQVLNTSASGHIYLCSVEFESIDKIGFQINIR